MQSNTHNNVVAYFHNFRDKLYVGHDVLDVNLSYPEAYHVISHDDVCIVFVSYLYVQYLLFHTMP